MYADSLRKLLAEQDLECFLSSEWSSSQVGHRERMRQALVADLAGLRTLSNGEREHLMDLNATPQVPGSSLSLSHCRLMGGYVRASSKTPVGFDVEVIDRVHEAVAKKLSCDSREWQEAPSASSFWVAKEAAFKSLFKSGLQPAVVSKVKIGHWHKVDSVTETCKILGIDDQEAPSNVGCVVALGQVKLSCFVLG